MPSSRIGARLTGPGSLQRAVSHFFEGGAPVMVMWSRNKERLDTSILGLIEELEAEGSTLRRHHPGGIESLLTALNALVEDLGAHELGGVGSSRNLKVLVIDAAENMSAEEAQALKRVVTALSASPVRFIVGACTSSQPLIDSDGSALLPSAVAWDLDADPIGIRDDSKLEFDFVKEPSAAASEPPPPRIKPRLAVRQELPEDDQDGSFIKWIGLAAAAVLLLTVGWNWREIASAMRFGQFTVETDPAKLQFDCGRYPNAIEATVIANAAGPLAKVVPAGSASTVQVTVGPFKNAAELENTKAKLWTLGACSLLPQTLPGKR